MNEKDRKGAVDQRCFQPLGQIRRPVVFFANGIGDGVLCIPALRALCARYQGRARLILKKGPDRFLFESLPAEQLLFLDMWRNGTGDGSDFAVETTQEILRDCDMFVSFAEWRSGSLSRIKSECNALTVGFYDDFDICVPESASRHQFDAMFSIPRLVFPELRIEEFSGALTFSHKVEGAGQEILRALGRPIHVGFHPESSDPAKSCPRPLVEKLAGSLLELGDDVVVCIFGQERGLATLERISDRVIVFNRLPLELAAYLISRMTTFVGVDSCFLHIADLSRVPGVGLFGPTNCSHWGFRFGSHQHMQSPGTVGDIEPLSVTNAVRSHIRDLTQREQLRSIG